VTSHWPMVKLGEVLEVLNGFAFSSKQFNSEGVGLPLIRIRDVNSGYSRTFYSGDYDPKFLIENGDLLVGMDGDFKSTLWAHGTALLNQRVCKLHSFTNISKEFLKYFIDIELSKIQSTTNAATVKHLSSKQIENIEIPLPPLEEQKRIVAKLDEALGAVDALKANTAQSKSELDAFWQSALTQSFSSDWPMVKLGQVSEVDWGNTNLTKTSYVEDGEFIGVSAAGLDGRIDFAEHVAFTPVISAIGANCGKMFMPTEPFTAIKNTMTVTPRRDLLDNWYLYHCLGFYRLPRRGAGQPFISKGDAQEFLIPLPPVDEQKRIVAKLDEIKSELDRQREILDSKELETERLRSSILSAAFNGEL